MPNFREPPKYGIDTDVMNYLMGQHKPRLPEDEDDYLGKMQAATTPGVMGVMADSAAKMGTIGGVQADAAPVQKFAQGLQQQQMQDDKMQMGREQKLAQYLGGIKKAQTERDMDLYDTKGKRDHELGMARIKASAKSPKGSKIQGILDQNAAKEYSTFVQSGKEQSGFAINKLSDKLDVLEKQKGKFFQIGGGPMSGSMYDWTRDPKSIELRDEIQGVAMLTLKDIFVGAISDAEREAVAATYYNDKISPDANIPILKRQLSKLRRIYDNKLRRMRYFEDNEGSMAGYKGTSVADDLKSIRERDPAATDELKQELPAGMVKMIAPNGRTMTVPLDDVQGLEAKGAKRQ